MRLEWSIDFVNPDPQLTTMQVETVHALDRALDAIADDAAEPLIAELVNEQGARLGIGLGLPQSVLAFNASAEPPYLISVGGIGSHYEDVAFYLHGHWTEFPRSALLPNEDARAAARLFLTTGVRPDNVSWEEV